MATIRTTLELVDNISGRLAAIGGRVGAVADQFMHLDRCINGVQNSMAHFEMCMPEWNMPETPVWNPQPETSGLMRVQLPEAVSTGMAAPELLTPEWGVLSVPEPGFGMENGLVGDGFTLLQGMAEAMQAQQGMLQAAAAAAADAAVLSAQQAASPAVGMAIGADFAAGIAQGIRSRVSAVAAAARSAASAAASAARSALDIHSPSRVAQEIGAYFGAGFAGGIADSGTEVSKAVARLSGIAYRELDGEIWSGLRIFSELEQAQHAPGESGIYLNQADVRRMRELAEREAVQRFTTAELRIDFTANNTIDSKMDLDSVVSYLEEQVAERLALAAEGVYR